jgi:hypothetical protein
LEDSLVSENKIFEIKMNTNLVGSNLNNVLSNNNKLSIYNQLPSNIREDLDNHIWELISYNPIKFIVAHSENKQIVYARLYKNQKRVESDNISSEPIWETIWNLEFSRVIIGSYSSGSQYD